MLWIDMTMIMLNISEKFQHGSGHYSFIKKIFRVLFMSWLQSIFT